MIEALFTQNEGFEISVIQQRLPRTVFGVLAGASLAVSGCLMQTITRNPIADPGILGVNSGAALFVVCGISFFHISHPVSYIALGFFRSFVDQFSSLRYRIIWHGSHPFKTSAGRCSCFYYYAVLYQYDHFAQYTSDGYISILANW